MWLTGVGAMAEDSFDDVEYISGKTGLDKRKKGTLVVSEGKLLLKEKDGTEIFSLPANQVTSATSHVVTEEGGVATRVFINRNALERVETVNVNFESLTEAGCIILRCKKKNTGPQIAAKVNFAAKKAKGEK